MTEEDTFQAVLDANPQDQTTRLALADWLMERGDPRGVGYRALGLLGRFAEFYGEYFVWFNKEVLHDPEDLEQEWFQQLSHRSAMAAGFWVKYETRREADDVAAAAFSRLTVEQQNEILSQVGATV